MGGWEIFTMNWEEAKSKVVGFIMVGMRNF